jgi:hypothetical protein
MSAALPDMTMPNAGWSKSLAGDAFHAPAPLSLAM